MADNAKVIDVKSKVKNRMDFELMLEFQEDLKVLDKKLLKNFSKRIAREGFLFPFFLWKEEETKLFHIIDGHQRKAALQHLKDLGYQIPPVPYIEIIADTKEEAKKRVLEATSQIGEMTDDGFANFIKNSNLNFEEIKNELRFSDLNLGKIENDFFKDSIPELIEKDMDDSIQFIVSVHCDNENQMADLYEELKSRNFECKLIT